MTEQEKKLKLVAEYDGYVYDSEYFAELLNKKGVWEHKDNGDMIFDVSNFIYASSYDWQIPVWQKVCKEAQPKFSSFMNFDFIKIEQKYYRALKYNTPLESFEILVQAIQFINNLKQK